MTSVVLDARVVAGSGGGPDKTILNSPRFLEGGRYRMLCAYLRPPGDVGFARLRERALAWGAPLIEVDDRGALDLGVIGRLIKICSRENVTIWHGHDYKTNLLGLILRPFWPMRLVTTVHGWGHETKKLLRYYAIDRLCLPRYERVLCVSDDLLVRCRALGIPEERCLPLINGVDTNQFRRSRDRAEAKGRLGLPEDRLLIGAVGRLSDEKGFDLLIRALRRLVDAGLNAAVAIVGEGPERRALEALIAELGLTGRAHLLGYRDDVVPVYEALDIYALTSHREGLPNVVLEALSLDLAVVATRVAGVPTLIEDGRSGLLIEPGSIDELTRSLAELATDGDLRARLGSAGRVHVETKFSFAERMRKLESIYDALLGSSADLPRPVGVAARS